MSFTGFEWLAWIVVTAGLFWAVPGAVRIRLLVAVTAVFMAWHEPWSLGVLAVFAAIVHLTTRGPRPSGRRAVTGIVPIVAVLVGYKIASAASGDDLVVDTIIPLGLSYYALRCIHYVVERYRGNIRDLGPEDLIGYLFFLPTIVVGPIHRFPEWKRTVRRHHWDHELFFEGIERLLHGYVKIGFLANFVVGTLFSGWIEAVALPGTGREAYLEMVRIGLDLYLRFSGYSDIAIGFALMLGYRVMENFSWPFFKRNISEFWSSWHISLTSWSREYVYTSAVAITRSPAVGAIASLLAIALWHEVSVRYLLWGIYHGLGIVIWQAFRNGWRDRIGHEPHRLGAAIGRVASTTLTVHFVLLGFYLVRQPDVAGIVDATTVLFTRWGAVT